MTECVYVAAGVNGLLKVGKTTNPMQRKAGLHGQFKARGDRLTRFHHCAQLPHAYGAERCLIEAISSRVQLAGGREWFRYGNFDHAVRAAEELTAYYAEELKNWKPYVLPPGYAERVAAERALEKRRHAEWKAVNDAARERRRRLRNPGVHVIGGVVAVLIGQPGAPAVPTPEPGKVTA